MTAGKHDARLELAYRRLLLAYPADYRHERGDELVSTLLASAPPGRRRPTIAEAFDLLYHGIRTRARVTRRTLSGPAAADELAQAAVVSLTVAAAVAVAVIVGVSFLGQPVFYRHPESSYPVPVRAGVGLVLATFPAALAFLSGNRPRVARRLAALGGLWAVGFAAWLSVHAVHIQNERIATLEDLHWIAPESVPDETLEPSNLFGLVTLLCVPAVLLMATRSTSDHRRRVGHGAAFAGLLGTAFIVLTTTDLLARARLAVLGPEGTSTGPAPSLHDTGLTQGIAVALVAAVVWHVVRQPRSQGLTVAFAMSLPALGYAIGTLLTPMAFRPGWSRTENLALNLLEVAFVATVAATLAAWAIASVRQQQNTPRVASGENCKPRQNPV
jgi:hypothetical protein